MMMALALFNNELSEDHQTMVNDTMYFSLVPIWNPSEPSKVFLKLFIV